MGYKIRSLAGIDSLAINCIYIKKLANNNHKMRGFP